MRNRYGKPVNSWRKHILKCADLRYLIYLAVVYILSMSWQYFSAIICLFILRVGPSSPPMKENSPGKTVNFCILWAEVSAFWLLYSSMAPWILSSSVAEWGPVKKSLTVTTSAPPVTFLHQACVGVYFWAIFWCFLVTTPHLDNVADNHRYSQLLADFLTVRVGTTF